MKMPWVPQRIMLSKAFSMTACSLKNFSVDHTGSMKFFSATFPPVYHLQLSVAFGPLDGSISLGVNISTKAIMRINLQRF